MMPRLYVGDARVAALPPDARALAYGDGLFETMRLHAGSVPWWPSHRRRLELGAQRLGLQLPDASVLETVLADAAAEQGDGVLKLLVSRGSGTRGYAPAGAAAPIWLLSAHPAPAILDRLRLRWCALRLALQPRLAGIKHCARLEQVLARGEWDDPSVDEGLLCSTEGDVVCATAANLFILQHGRWRTPAVDRCGVAGICRQWAIGELDAEQARLQVADIESAEAIFLCNAVRGILEVAELLRDAAVPLRWSPHPGIAHVRHQLAQAHPAFATDGGNT